MGDVEDSAFGPNLIAEGPPSRRVGRGGTAMAAVAPSLSPIV